MRGFLKSLLVFVGIFFVVVTHLYWQYIVPDPFGHVHVVLLAAILGILLTESGFVVWASFLMAFILETLRVSSFGIELFSITFAVLIGLWLYRFIFTNRSWYAAFMLGFVVVGIHRILYFFAILLEQWFTTKNVSMPSDSIAIFMWESLATAFASALVYLLLIRFSRRLSITRLHK